MTRFQSRAALAICMAIALPLLAAEKFGAKTGLWETTTTTNMGGMTMPAMPPEALASMPPAQRAQIEQMMKQMGAQGPRTTTAKSCVTDKDLAEGAFRQREPQQDMKCKFTVVTSTAKKQDSTFQCSSAAGTADGRMSVEAVSNSHVKGTMQMKSPQMSLDVKFESKWLGADCGTTK